MKVIILHSFSYTSILPHFSSNLGVGAETFPDFLDKGRADVTDFFIFVGYYPESMAWAVFKRNQDNLFLDKAVNNT